MELLGILLSSTSARCSSHSDVDVSPAYFDLVPRLWPFLSHTISSVRKSSLKALLMLLGVDGGHRSLDTPSSSGQCDEMDSTGGTTETENTAEVKVHSGGWLKGVLQTLLCQIFQRFALEGLEDIRQLLHEVLYNGSLFVWTCNELILAGMGCRSL